MSQKKYVPTLCWDCARAKTDHCSWFKGFKPVKGWDATPTDNKEFKSYIVHECPEFIRDAYSGGTRKTKPAPRRGSQA